MINDSFEIRRRVIPIITDWWSNEGKPVCLAGASMDCIEWAILLDEIFDQCVRKGIIRHDMASSNKKRLRNSISVLQDFIEQEASE